MDTEIKDALLTLQQAVETGFADVYRRFDEVDRRFDEVDRRFDKVNTGFKDVNDRIAVLADQQARYAQIFDRRLTETNVRLDDMNQRMTNTNARLDDMNERLSTLVSAFMKSRTEDLQRSFELEERVRRLEKS
jgi:division protein CdvB (Snf7/Vps24/ESCRT-III family)